MRSRLIRIGNSRGVRLPKPLILEAGLDQVRTVDRDRVVRKLGSLAPRSLLSALTVLQEMFAP